jgi:hypothetical protein
MDKTSFQGAVLAILPCTVEGDMRKKVAIYVRAMSEIKEYFMRIKSDRFELLDLKDFTQLKYHEKNICVERERLTRKNQSSLSKAAENGYEAVVKLLLEEGAKPELEDGEGRTPLGRAAEKGHKAVVKLLLEKGAELESEDGEGRTSLGRAAEKGHKAVVKLLLEKGAKPELGDWEGQTPLRLAAENGHEAVVMLLLEKVADKS